MVLSFMLADIAFSLLFFCDLALSQGGLFTVTWASIHCGYLLGITCQ